MISPNSKGNDKPTMRSAIVNAIVMHPDSVNDCRSDHIITRQVLLRACANGLFENIPCRYTHDWRTGGEDSIIGYWHMGHYSDTLQGVICTLFAVDWQEEYHTHDYGLSAVYHMLRGSALNGTGKIMCDDLVLVRSIDVVRNPASPRARVQRMLWV